MRKIIQALIGLILITVISPIHVKAVDVVSINDLIENSKELDGQVITIQGEAIGESMNRGEYSWININDGTNAIGVWVKSDTADQIQYYGNYHEVGDTIEVTGTFYRACAAHGGEADFHADTFNIIKNGHLVSEHIDRHKIVLAIISSVFAFLLILVYQRQRKLSEISQENF
ncbi:MAG TPA: hypothetical protein VN258_09480 [Mobilitalea sp.]|nr:hypothetical protein [Mobilitalea sp.]